MLFPRDEKTLMFLLCGFALRSYATEAKNDRKFCGGVMAFERHSDSNLGQKMIHVNGCDLMI